MGKFAHHLLVVAIAVSAADMTAFAAGTAFDGSYGGPTTVTFGSEPVCGAGGPASVAVKDGELQYAFGAFPLKLEVAQDGTFTGKARKGNRGGGQSMHVKGRIHDSVLEASFVVNGVHRHVCSYHWALRKE